MMSAKMTNLGFLKTKVFLNKVYDVINSVHDFTNKILSRDSIYITDMVIWQKFSNYERRYRNLNFIRIQQEKT